MLNKQAGLTDIEKEALIVRALGSESGKMALAQAMATPIRLSLDYQSVGRKLLVVDPLPQGALPVYDRDVESSAAVIGKRQGAPSLITEGDRITVPTFEIVSHPKIRFSEIKQRRFSIIDRAQQRAKAEVMAEEDGIIFGAIDMASDIINPVVSSAGFMSRTSLSATFKELEKHDLVVSRILMHPEQFADIRGWTNSDFDPVTQREVLHTGLFGHIWTADILVSRRVKPGNVYVMADPEFLGVMPIRQDIQVLPADAPADLMIGFVVYEEIGVAVANSRAVTRLEIV
jgi:hypothetical protein